MGPVTIHRNENLAPSDKGVALMRQRLREQIRTVAEGKPPSRATDLGLLPLPTYGGDTVLKVPRRNDEDESESLSKLAHAFMDLQFEADTMAEPQRLAFVTDGLKKIESAGLD